MKNHGDIESRIQLNRREDLNNYRNEAPEVLNIEDAAKFLGVSPRTLSESVDELKIPYRRIGRKHIFARDCLVEWVKEGANAESEHQSSNQS